MLLDLPALWAHVPVLAEGGWVPVPNTLAALSLPDPNAGLAPGTIINVNFDGHSRGPATEPPAEAKKKPSGKGKSSASGDHAGAAPAKKSASFKNSIIINMYMGAHNVANFKVSPHGKFQLTGCKSNEQFTLPVVHLLRAVHKLHTSSPDLGVVQQRRGCAPMGEGFAGYQVWAVIVMRNIYFDLPFHQDLERLSRFILQQSESFVPTYESGISPAMQVKYSPSLPMDKRVPFFSVRDEALEAAGTPEFSFSADSTDNLLVVQTKDEADRLFKKKKISLIVYNTKKVFMSGRGEEMANVYVEFCALIERYYRESSREEKQGAMQPLAGSRKKSAKKARCATSAVSPAAKPRAAEPPSAAAGPLAALMQSMRLASLHRSEAERGRDLK